MSDSKESGVTYTDISSPFEELSDIRSPRADDHEHLMLPEILEDPYIEDQPYAEDASPIAQSPEYVPESDFEAHPEDDADEDPEEDPVDYPADGGDDGDDEEESSKDDEDEEDDEMDVEADEEDEEEQHPAPADLVVVAPTATDQAPSAEETEPFETDEEDRPEVTLPPRKRLDIALGPRYEVGESSSATPARPGGGFRADYGFVTTVDREIMRNPEREVSYGITDLWDEIVETLIFRNLTGIVFSYDQKQMAPRRTTRSTADQEIVNATTVTNAQLQTMIDQGVTAALAACDALRSTNGDDSHNSRTGVRRTKRAARECTYTDFIKCQPLPFKGTEGTVGHDAAYGMSWKTLMKMMTDKYFPRNDIRKLEMELCELKVMGTDLARYTQRFQELALLCGRMFSKESDKVEKYVGSLFDMIHVSVVASKPKTMQEAIEIATELMDKKIRTFAERETASKRKFENTSRTTQNQQQQQSNKRQNTGRVYTSASGKKKQYGGSRPLCAKCNYHHDGPCAPKCCNCNKFGHATRDCRNTANTNNANNQRGTELGQKPTRGRNNAPARVYAVGCAGTDPDANVITGKFLLNNRYASILFDTGADRSFVSTTFSTQINVTLSTLDHCYDVELADERIIGLNTILRGCTLNLLNHQFNIDLMPVEREKYVKKGFPIFLAHITTKEVEDKSQKKRHEDVPIVRDFPEVFPEDLPGLLRFDQ
nr:hypothetical protein [Tanacetum cinerariifolium]